MSNKLAYILRRTGAVDVYVNREQVVELIGEEKTEELSQFDAGKTEVRTGRVGRRSLIPAKKRVKSTGLSGFNRKELLAAILEAQGADFQAEDDPNDSLLEIRNTGNNKDLPNTALLPREKQLELKDRGLTE